MQRLLKAAEATGWKTVLENDIKKKAPAVVGLISDKRRSSFMELLPGIDGGTAVDVGCGFGGISLQLAQRFDRVFSLDSGLERLQFLNLIRKQENIGNIVPVHHEDAAALPFISESVDLAVMVGVFEYLPLSYPDLSISEAQRRVLGELHRVLKPGGCLYIGTKNRFGWPYLKGSADHNGLPFGPVLPRTLANWLTSRLYAKPYRIIVDSYPGYGKLLARAGFADTRVYWPVPGYQAPDRFVPLDSTALAGGAVNGSTGWRASTLATLQRSGALKYIAPHFSIVARKAYG